MEPRSSHGRESGVAAVEFALVLPLLVLMVFGIFEFGRAYHTQIQLSGAAREGVRVMAIQNDQNAARNATIAAAPSLTLTAADVAISTDPPTSPTTCSSGVRVTVQVVRPVTYNIPLFGSAVWNLEGTGVMRCGG